MDRFRTEAARRGIAIAYLTRPHKLPPEELSRNATWRGSVPKYNAALKEWGRANNVPVLDAQRYFEQLPPEIFSDECHFTPAGYERMAKLVRDELVNATQAAPEAARRSARGESDDARQR
jgi:lysophospholipase L1-like esterase